MKVTLDNIIFSLQRYGGISVVWNEHLTRARADEELQVTELDYKTQIKPRLGERYRVPNYTPETPSIFHSSYFRVLPQNGIHNVTTVHDLTYHFYRHGLAKKIHLWEEERALHHSDAIICISENTKHDVLHLYPWLKEKKIHVIYNGVSDVFHPISSIEKKGYLLYVGNRSVAYKRFEVALEVAHLTGLELRTVGSPDITREDLNRFYNEALCLLYPSDYEGFGLPILEAQKAGCPVIAQCASSIPEVMGDSGIMVAHDTPQRMALEIADRVKLLLSRPTQSLVKAGIQNAKRFSWDKTYEQTKQVYKQLLS